MLALRSTALTGSVNILDGTLTGVGTLNGNLQNGGRVSIGDSPGVLQINGDFTQTSAGLLAIEVGGPAAFEPGVNFDQLRVSGNASLGGTLQLIQLPSFESFAQGGSLSPLTYGSSTGAFAAIVNIGAADFDPQLAFGPTSAVASAVLQPPGTPEENAGDVSQDVSELADQQDDLENCGVDEDEAPPNTQVEEGHGVGCRGG